MKNRQAQKQETEIIKIIHTNRCEFVRKKCPGIRYEPGLLWLDCVLPSNIVAQFGLENMREIFSISYRAK